MPDARSAAVAGRLELAQSGFTAGEELEYIVVNTGELPIMLEAAYVLERFEQHGWRVANPDAAFPAWGARLAPSHRARLTTCLPASLPAGSYRLRKRLLADRDPHPGYEWVALRDVAPCEAIAEFTVDTRSAPPPPG